MACRSGSMRSMRGMPQAEVLPEPVSAMVENRDDNEAMELVERQVMRLETAYKDVLERGKAAGEIRADARSDRIARMLITTGHGIGLLTRLPDSGPRIGDAVAGLLELIDSVAV